jgi:thymidylate synthase (FAD)
MIIIPQSYTIETSTDHIGNMARRIERIGRVCYKSEDKITNTSADAFVKKIIVSGHESVIEHEHITVRFICDRGVSHELVRHRIASYSQESTRYCNYSTTKNKDIQLIHPKGLTDAQRERREAHYWNVQSLYEQEISEGIAPQIARGILPTSLKTEIVMTANLREWRFVTKIRGAAGAHPQMIELMVPLRNELHGLLPLVF